MYVQQYVLIIDAVHTTMPVSWPIGRRRRRRRVLYVHFPPMLNPVSGVADRGLDMAIWG